MDTDDFLAGRLRSLRAARGLTLEQLAELSGVSRSMISLIERRETSPTAAVLHKLAAALGLPMAELFTAPQRDALELPLARHAEQAVWTDPATGYQRRHLSPTEHASPLDLVELLFPPGEQVVFEQLQRGFQTHQQLWMLEGEMEITLGDKAWRLRAGDCLAMVLDQRLVFRNPGRQPARYLLALTTTPAPHRRQP